MGVAVTILDIIHRPVSEPETETSSMYWAELRHGDRSQSPKRRALNKRQDDRKYPELW
jgi:hypothetical protein